MKQNQEVVIIACGEDNLIRRAVCSIVENASQHGHHVSITICDDSRESNRVSATSGKIVQKCNAGGDTAWIGRESKRKFVTRLSAHALVDPAIIAFGLFGERDSPNTTGANRNCALLHTVGQQVILSDADVLWDMRVAPGCVSQKATSPLHYAPANIVHYASREDVERSLSKAPLDHIGLHQRLLGRSVLDCIGERDIEVGLYAAANACNVAVTYPGIWGDSAARDAAPFLLKILDERRVINDEDVRRILLKRGCTFMI